LPDKFDVFLDKVMPYLAAAFILFGIVFFATNSFGATPVQPFNKGLSQSFTCKHMSEKDVTSEMGEGVVLRGVSLDRFLRALSELSGQPNPDMESMRVYPVPDQSVHMIVAFQGGCVVGAAFIPNQVINQLLQRAGV